MPEESKRTKEEIQAEYNLTMMRLGEHVYKYFVPLIEANTLLVKSWNLNHEMFALKEKEKAPKELDFERVEST